MNRDIEFRGQRIDNGEWAYGYLYQLPLPSGIGCMILTTDNINEDNSIEPEYHLAFTLWVDLFPVKPDTIGQYTGLKDKNGKEIYEGDILKSAFSKKPFGVVAWNNGGGYFYILETFDFIEGRAGCEHRPLGEMLTLDIDGQKVDFEVIGNIFDNPELLKEDGSK